MKCATCIEEGKESSVKPIENSNTLVSSSSFWDDRGKFHAHDKNVYTTVYECSNNHVWKEQSYATCWCGWSGGDKTSVKINR